MPDMIQFQGQTTSTPSVLNFVNDTALVPIATGTGNALVIMGYSTGGQPNTLLGPFASPAAAKAVLGYGQLLVAVTKAFNVSTSLNRPSQIYAMNVGSASDATVTLKDASGAAALQLTTTQYGNMANQARVEIAAGSVKGSLITTGYTGGAAPYQDNVGRNAFTLAYSGTGTSPAVTVSAQQVELLFGSTINTTFNLNNFQSIAALVDAINAVPNFQATIDPASVNKQALNGLDPVVGEALSASPLAITANLQAQIDYFNSATSSGIFTATRLATATGPAAPIGWSIASGATTPAPLVSDWVNAFTALQAGAVNWISVLSPMPAVWAAAAAHCQTMKEANKPRRAFVGPDLGTSRTAVALLPASINSDLVTLAWPGYQDFDSSGNLVTWPPYMHGALMAAGWASLAPGQSMTNVPLAIQGLEQPVAIPSDTDVLLPAAVCPVAQNEDGLFVVVRGVSTWLANNAYDKVETSCGVAVDYAVQAVRNRVKQRLGTQGNQGYGVGPITLSGCISYAATELDFCAKPTTQGGAGVLVGDAGSPAWSGLSAEGSGDSVSMQWTMQPVIPLNFILNSIAVVPYSGSVTVSTTVNASSSSSTLGS